jgi:putative DNA primase/helicase
VTAELPPDDPALNVVPLDPARRAKKSSKAKKPSARDDEDSGELVERLEPAAVAVHGADLADRIATTITAHIRFTSAAEADAVALWAIGTFLIDRWPLYPRLAILSPEKRCGKTTLLEVLEGLSLKSLILGNTSTAATFRIIDALQPTLLLDEADAWLRQNEELRGVINAGHRKRSAKIVRMVEKNGDHVAKIFNTFAAMAIAGIGRLPDTIEDRSVIVQLRRKTAGETLDRMPRDFFERHQPMRRQALRWALDHANAILASKALPPSALAGDRAADNWQPLFQIADILGGNWRARAGSAFKVFAGRAADDGNMSGGELLLRDLAEILPRWTGDRITSAELLAELLADTEGPWSTWSRGQPLTAHALARFLKAYGIKPRQAFHQGIKTRHFLVEDLHEAVQRYVADSPK